MIRILLDTNVALDLLLHRAPWAADAEAIRIAHTNGAISAHLTASSLTDVFYLARRLVGRDGAWDAVRSCLDHFHVIAVGMGELQSAAVLPSEDFEDNLRIACAVAMGLEFIVTRDTGGFADSPVPILEPPAFLAKLPGV